MLRDLMQHKAYLIFWGGAMLIFLAVACGMLYELHRIVQLLKK